MKYTRQLIAALGMSAMAIASQAEDIDLFLGVPPTSLDDLPNVLLFIDNTGNWTDAFPTEKIALQNTFNGLQPGTVKVGIMFYGQPDLGYVRAGIRLMNTHSQGLYGDLIGDLDSITDRGSARTLARTMSEIHRYLTSGTTVEPTDPTQFDDGENKWRDYKNNADGNASTKAVHDLWNPANVPDPNDWDESFINPLDSDGDRTYTSPLDPDSCANTYIIYIGNTVSGGNVVKDNSSRNTKARNELSDAGGDISTISLTNSQHQDNYADEWARFLHDQYGIITYAIDVDPTPHPEWDDCVTSGPGTKCGPGNGIGNSDLLYSMSAGVGGGKYFRVNSGNVGDLELVIDTIFTEILATNSVFASVALPASATGQSVFLNQVFIGLFRPDESAFPSWPGNLKQYQLGKTGTDITLRDAKGNAAISANADNSFIADCAVSFWSESNTGANNSYWSFAPEGECSGSADHDSEDGPIVQKGAQAHMLRQMNPMSRTMYTCDYDLADCNATNGLRAFNTSNGDITSARMALTTATKDDLIKWSRGSDMLDENAPTGSTPSADQTEMRAYAHHDVIHSRPVALNYGTDDAPQVVVYYGANDGALRAINGNQTGDVASVSPGQEIWSFMPTEFWDDLERLMINTEVVKFPASGAVVGSSGSPKSYGMDGTVTAFDGTFNSVADSKYIFATMRRGGRSVYAFNVTTPGSPSLAWKKGCMEDVGTATTVCSTATGGLSWADIGQTWAPAQVVDAAGYSNPVMLLGGGYDPCEDTDTGVLDPNGIPVATPNANHSCTSTDWGDHVYIVDAYDGTLLNVLDTDRAVPGGVTIVPVSSTDRRIEYAYLADTGGNVYRISGPIDGSGSAAPIGSTLPANWEIEKIAVFGCGTDATTSCTSPRKFLFPPDVVKPLGVSGEYRIVLGSGDREKPLLSYASAYRVQNNFYSFIDKPTNGAWMDDVSPAVCNADYLCADRLDKITSVSETAPTLTSTHGYYVELGTGEQVVTGTLVVDDLANFSTHVAEPKLTPGACTNGLGDAFTYNIDFDDGDGKKVDIIGGGLVPTPVAGKVLIDGKEEPFCIGCGGENSPIGGSTVGGSATVNAPKGRVYWKIQE